MSTHELAAKVKELKELQTFIEELTAEADAIKDELKAHMKAAGASELTVDIFKLRYSSVTSNRFDTNSFKATHGELYAQFCKPTISTRFCVV